MKTDKVILGVLGGLAAGAIMGIFALKERKKERKIKIQATIMQTN
jgi:predicted small secreted protein